MHRPEHLRLTGQGGNIARLTPWIVSRKTAVVPWVPILRSDYELKLGRYRVNHWDDFVALLYRESAARKEVVLNVNDGKRTHWNKFKSPSD
jgi:hypothetical protein